MGFPPQGYGAKPIEIWEYTTRRVTNLGDARAAYIDLIPLVEHETEWSTDPNMDDITHIALTEYNLTDGDMGIINYPSNATEVRFMLLPIIRAVNQTAVTHHIEVTVQYSEDDGAWTDIIDLTATPPMGLPSLDGVVDSLSQPLDVSAIIETGKKYEFRHVVESDNAGAVHYLTSFVLVLVYRMGG